MDYRSLIICSAWAEARFQQREGGRRVPSVGRLPGAQNGAFTGHRLPSQVPCIIHILLLYAFLHETPSYYKIFQFEVGREAVKL